MSPATRSGHTSMSLPEIVTREEWTAARKALLAKEKEFTRARDALHLVLPQRFYVHGQAARGDRHVYASRTRFIPAKILEKFEACAWPPAGAAAGQGAQPEVRVDLKSRMRGMWR